MLKSNHVNSHNIFKVVIVGFNKKVEIVVKVHLYAFSLHDLGQLEV